MLRDSRGGGQPMETHRPSPLLYKSTLLFLARGKLWGSPWHPAGSALTSACITTVWLKCKSRLQAKYTPHKKNAIKSTSNPLLCKSKVRRAVFALWRQLTVRPACVFETDWVCVCVRVCVVWENRDAALSAQKMFQWVTAEALETVLNLIALADRVYCADKISDRETRSLSLSLAIGLHRLKYTKPAANGLPHSLHHP